MSAVFQDIYQRNLWNGVESRSGPGSGAAATSTIRAQISTLVRELGLRSVLDAACGDGFWMPDLPGYLGIDVAPEAIRIARRRHPGRRYQVGDVRDITTGYDLVIFRDALQHLPFADGKAALHAIRWSGSRFLLASTYTDGENVDVAAGEWYRPDLTAAPFYLRPPVKLIFDGYDYDTGDTRRDPGKFLGLWAL